MLSYSLYGNACNAFRMQISDRRYAKHVHFWTQIYIYFEKWLMNGLTNEFNFGTNRECCVYLSQFFISFD